MMSRILNAAQVAAILRIDVDDVLGMVADGELPALSEVEDENDVLIAEASLREFLAASWVGEPWGALS